MDVEEMLKLPIYLQLSLGSGFLAYVIAFHGRRQNEKTSDLLFGTIAFSLPGILLWLTLQEFSYAIPQSAFMVILLTILLGFLWKKWGRKSWFNMFYEARLSNSEGTQTTWQRLLQDTSIVPRLIAVRLKSGKLLVCNNIQNYSESVISGWSIDDIGNIAMYVTEVDGKNVTQEVSTEEGDLITYIPASEIQSVAFRFVKN